MDKILVQNNSLKILLVDDDEDLRSELRDFLEGYDIIEASDGNTALNLLKKANNIDMVILDIIMPGLNGIDVLKEIKKIDSNISVVMLTGHSSKNVAIEALKGRADDYVEKPLDFIKLKNIIDKLFEPKKGEGNIDTTDIKGKIEKIKHFIERNCFKKIFLKDVSDIVFLSPKYLSRIFKEYTGTNFNEYKLKVKTEKAKELLTKTGCNINQIADKLGYENTESFIRQFKKITNLTPTEYRKKKKK